MANYDVLWDGRRDGPGGRYLFTSEPETRAPEVRQETVRGATSQVIAHQLRRQPQTLRELVVASGLTMDTLNSALYYMRKRGEVVVVGQGRDGGRWGRKTEHVYGLPEAPRRG